MAEHFSSDDYFPNVHRVQYEALDQCPRPGMPLRQITQNEETSSMLSLKFAENEDSRRAKTVSPRENLLTAAHTIEDVIAPPHSDDPSSYQSSISSAFNSSYPILPIPSSSPPSYTCTNDQNKKYSRQKAVRTVSESSIPEQSCSFSAFSKVIPESSFSRHDQFVKPAPSYRHKQHVWRKSRDTVLRRDIQERSSFSSIKKRKRQSFEHFQPRSITPAEITARDLQNTFVNNLESSTQHKKTNEYVSVTKNRSLSRRSRSSSRKSVPHARSSRLFHPLSSESCEIEILTGAQTYEKRAKLCVTPSTKIEGVPHVVSPLSKQKHKSCVPEGVVDLDNTSICSTTSSRKHSSWLDQHNRDNSSYASSYGQEYYKHLFQDELETSLSVEVLRSHMTGSDEIFVPKYLSFQKELTVPLRGAIVDWLVEVAYELGLHNSTLHSAIKLFDRVLSCIYMERKDLQCLGSTCLLMAAKLEETRPPTTSDHCYVSGKAFTKKQLVNMELRVSTALKFRLRTVSPYHFVDRFVKASDATAGDFPWATSLSDPVLETLVEYLIELTTLHPECIEMRSSLVTASAIYLARATLNIRDSSGTIWSKTLQYYTGYDKIDLVDAVKRIHSLQVKARDSDLKRIYDKYKKRMYFKVALRPIIHRKDLDIGF